MKIETLFKTYMVQNAIRDAAKFVGKQLKNIDWDTDEVLHRVGLARHTPGRSTFGGISLFVVGAALGGVAAMLLAPQPGAQLRTDLRDRAKKYFGVEEPIQAPLGAEASPRIENPNARV